MLEPLNLPDIPCWDLLRHPRAWSIGDDVWDIFGFLVEEDVPIFLNAFTGGDLVLARVDYPHSHHRGSRTSVKYTLPDDEDDHTTYAYAVCIVRAVKHLANRWVRYTQRKTQGRLLARLELPYTHILSYAV